MHTVLGVGKQRIIYLNSQKSKQVNELFERIAKFYRMKHELGYPDICEMHRKSSLLFSDDTSLPKSNDVCVSIDDRPLGIYVGDHAYHKRIAQKVSHMAGIELFVMNDITHINIGIGGSLGKAEIYMILKDALLELPGVIYFNELF